MVAVSTTQQSFSGIGGGRGILAFAGRSSSNPGSTAVPVVRSSEHGAGRGQLSMAGSRPMYNPGRSYMPIRRRNTVRQSTTGGKKFTKSVVLVSSGENEVPRGKRRQSLQKAGAIIDLVDFYTDWNEQKVCDVIESSLRGLLDTSQPQPRLVQSTPGRILGV